MIEALLNALDDLHGVPATELAESGTVLALQRGLARYEALVARATTAWDTNGVWADDGARSGAAWLEGKTQLSKKSARRQLRLGRLARALPVVEEAWASGAIGTAQVEVLEVHHTPVTAQQMVKDQQLLVDQAAALPHRHFVRACAYWRQHADPDGVERDAARLHEAREANLSETFDGGAFGQFHLDAIGGGILRNVFRRIEQELFEADWAEAREVHGEHACVDHLPRTARQRRTDVLVEMARRASTAPADGREPMIMLTVLTGHESVNRLCELADGTVVTPGSLLPWLDHAYVERVVFDGPSRVIDVGIRQRLFTGATRRAIEVRDRECFHPLCDRPAPECQADHIIPFSAGGPTTQDNGRMACPHHNRDRHTNDKRTRKNKTRKNRQKRPPP